MSTTTAAVTTAGREAELHKVLTTAGRACCCPARPVVLVIIPPGPGRPHPADLLLCGHHFRVSRKALLAAGAAVIDSRPDASSWHDLAGAIPA